MRLNTERHAYCVFNQYIEITFINLEKLIIIMANSLGQVPETQSGKNSGMCNRKMEGGCSLELIN